MVGLAGAFAAQASRSSLAERQTGRNQIARQRVRGRPRQVDGALETSAGRASRAAVFARTREQAEADQGEQRTGDTRHQYLTQICSPSASEFRAAAPEVEAIRSAVVGLTL